tara:strand:- start:301 stop:1170 length:870 start_codon:yes stop_codon:yes gene_type:complete
MNINSSLSHRSKEPENSILYIVGTPIGNLNDISLRAINILKHVSLIVCEDTRQTVKLLNRYEITNNLLSFNMHNSQNRISRIIEELKNQKSVAIVSDAGMPSICDPGEDLIKKVKLNKLEVICIPGPCAAITALVSSGFPSSSFIFMGFLPKKKTERNKLLLEISKSEKTIILYESPHRLKKLLIELKEYCGGEREIQVFRELTKIHEENVGNNLNMVLNIFEGQEIKGEITLVIKGAEKNEKKLNSSNLKKELIELINAGLSLSSASKYLAKKKNVKKSIIYNLHEDL